MARRKSKLGPRKIDGKKFQWKGWGHSKKRGREIAANYRKLGYSARVIPTKTSKTKTRVYDVYVRKKS